ncbi:MAG TPA: tryptophan 2,3-dioxygenase family protein [Nitrososphaerales archaeon]|nr:tryptophan 2,3-dioxygenase family protein [Nitrososphaerales archaeon]
MAQRKLASHKPQSYGDYLKLSDLLRLQQSVSEPPQHDELLFVVAHQTYELWFKLMLSELEASIDFMATGDAREASRLVKRVVAVLKVLTQQLEVLETMRPGDFAKFRDSLRPASGFQSLQFREIEFISGQKDQRFLEMHKDDPRALRVLERRMSSPSLWDGFCRLLVQRGLLTNRTAGDWPVTKVGGAVQKAFKDSRQADVAELADSLLEYDEAFWLWRNHHVGMVERVIGRNVGTGAAQVKEVMGAYSFRRSGVAYLKTTLRRRFFPALWAARTKMAT